MKILGLCGSQRLDSSNQAILEAAKKILSSENWLSFNLAELPYFDPVLQYSDSIPGPVLEVRSLAAMADCLFISTPEYAHGIPGILKNGLEWIFHEGTQKKPVYVVVGAGQGEHTLNQLIEVLSTMDFVIDQNQTMLIQGIRMKIDKNGNFQDEKLKQEFTIFVRSMLNCLSQSI